MDLSPPDCHKTRMRVGKQHVGGVSVLSSDPHQMKHTQEVDVFYLRFRVYNTGNLKAENVEVFASELYRMQADGTYKKVDSFLPMNLVWSHFHEMFIPAISMNTYKHCDLAHIIKPEGRETIPGEHKSWPNVPHEKTILSFDTVVKPYTKSYLLPHGKYRLKLIIAASNSRAKKKTLEINLTGNWYDEEDQMLGEGVRVQILN